MKKILVILAFCFPLVGCQHNTTPANPATLAPGFANAADQQMFQILSSARTFYSTVQCETKALNWSQAASQCVADPNIKTPMVLSAAEKTAFNKFGVALNGAEAVYQAFHAGTATQAQAQAQVSAVQAQQQALPALAVTK